MRDILHTPFGRLVLALFAIVFAVAGGGLVADSAKPAAPALLVAPPTIGPAPTATPGGPTWATAVHPTATPGGPTWSTAVHPTATPGGPIIGPAPVTEK